MILSLIQTNAILSIKTDSIKKDQIKQQIQLRANLCHDIDQCTFHQETLHDAHVTLFGSFVQANGSFLKKKHSSLNNYDNDILIAIHLERPQGMIKICLH